jgi:hypothetical protein
LARDESTALLREARGMGKTVEDGRARSLELAGSNPSSMSIASIRATICISIKRI